MKREVILKAEGLSRSFGFVQAVRDVSLELHAGEVVGFVGSNGAGKTSTLRILATLDYPDAGKVSIHGVDALLHPDRVRAMIGWMPDNFGAYSGLSVGEYLDFFASVYGFRGQSRSKRVDQVTEFVGLQRLTRRPSNRLSKGEAQRLSLGRTLLQDPSILLLDEPAAGLDPRARVEFRTVVRALRAEGKTIFLSSHILSDLEELCDSIIFIDHGRILHAGGVESLAPDSSAGQKLRIKVHGGAEALHAWVKLQPGILDQEDIQGGVVCTLLDPSPEAAVAFLNACVREGLQVCEFLRIESRLEDAFLKMVAGKKR